EVCMIARAVGNHEEEYGMPLSEIGAALIIADKSDAHRTRVRKGGRYDPNDIHDRVNYSIKSNRIVVNKDTRTIRFELQMDSSSSIMEYFEIFQRRMNMSEKAARFLNCSYEFNVNGVVINRPQPINLEEKPLEEGETEVSVPVRPEDML
ncbi:MAG TPA: hypothetical protein PLZ84_06680, partial [Clostridia bacterium]|nr:hypothetical protein [Clostridia bacterium]